MSRKLNVQEIHVSQLVAVKLFQLFQMLIFLFFQGWPNLFFSTNPLTTDSYFKCKNSYLENLFKIKHSLNDQQQTLRKHR